VEIPTHAEIQAAPSLSQYRFCLLDDGRSAFVLFGDAVGLDGFDDGQAVETMPVVGLWANSADRDKPDEPVFARTADGLLWILTNRNGSPW
jgi:hypothetical protein